MVLAIIIMAFIIAFMGYKWYQASELIQTYRNENIKVEKSLMGALKEIKSHIDINFNLAEHKQKLMREKSSLKRQLTNLRKKNKA